MMILEQSVECEMRNGRGNDLYSEKTGPSAILSTTNSPPRSKPATNRLSYGETRSDRMVGMFNCEGFG
jgi:hypothetical protein